MSKKCQSRSTAPRLILLAWATSIVAACGGGGGTPTTPSRPPQQLSIQVSPNPLSAVLIGTSDSSASFRISATVTIRESAGASGQITLISGTIVRQPGNHMSTGGLNVSLNLPASGTVSDTYTQDFDVSADIDAVSWRLTVSGTDSTGRPFTGTSSDIPISPPVIQPPPPPTQARYELWGGPNRSVFLGCFSCNQFASDSVFNQFGRYGSRFSQTSVANHFSRYGSEFSNDSACNRFASNPPVILNTATNTFTELTLNQFRQFAERSSAVVTVLRTVLCEVQ
jgi:hypothetical protein